MRRKALRGEELVPYEEMSDEQLQGMGHNEFLDLVEDVVLDLERMEAAVKRRQALYDRMRKTRLVELLKGQGEKVGELTELVLRLTETKGSVKWAEAVKTLKKMRPELAELIDELAEQHREKPSSRILKYKRRDEPQKWKPLEHVPLRQSRVAQDELHDLRLLKHLDAFLDRYLAELSAAVEQPRQMAAQVLRYRGDRYAALTTPEDFYRAIVENTDRYFDHEIAQDRFDETQRRLWDAIDAAGLHDEVMAIIRPTLKLRESNFDDYCPECENTGRRDEICPECSGSGEGPASGTSCGRCRGHGEVHGPCSCEHGREYARDEEEAEIERWEQRQHDREDRW